MKKIKALFLVCLLPFIVLAQTVLTNENVVQMVKDGLGAEIIKAKIKASSSNFDTSSEALKKLTENGVPEPVIVAMIEKQGEERKTESNTPKMPEQGTLSDIVGKKKVYVFSDDLKARNRIIKELEKNKFEVVDKLEDSDFVIKFEMWIETVGAVANTYGNSTTVSQSQIRIGLLTVAMPSADGNRVRLVHSVKKTQRFVWDDHPAESATKQLMKDFLKLNK